MGRSKAEKAATIIANRKEIAMPAKEEFNANETYMSCCFGHHIKNCECAALSDVTCMNGECPFYKSREEYYRDPYSGYVMKRDEYAAKKAENPRFRMMARTY